MTATLLLTREDPRNGDLALLMARHEADCSADTPPESRHRLGPELLAAPDIAFFVGRCAGVAVAMGALARIGPRHGEIKSMHVLAEWRGRGHARSVLDRLMAEARDRGLARVSLETGVQPVFRPARSLYASAGFAPCGPFGSYRPDPNSVFMTCSLGG